MFKKQKNARKAKLLSLPIDQLKFKTILTDCMFPMLLSCYRFCKPYSLLPPKCDGLSCFFFYFALVFFEWFKC